MFSEYDIFKRERIRLHCVVTLRSSLSHIGEVSGNVSNLKTAKLIDLEGNPRSCFVYSGNALRNGILRRVGTSSALESLGLTVNPDVHHTLFAGGRIDGSTANNMELDGKIRQLMPWLSVLGTAKPAGVFGVKNAQMVPGRLAVGSAYLVCYETAQMIYESMPGLLPDKAIAKMKKLMGRGAIASDPFTVPTAEQLDERAALNAECIPFLKKTLKTWTEFLTVDQTTRRDSTKDASIQHLLLPTDAPLLNGNGKEEKVKSDQMIASDRLIMAGAKLYSQWNLNTTEVETGWIVEALLKFSESPYLGGKSNRGNGLASLDFWFEKEEQRSHFLTVGTGQNQISGQAGDYHEVYQSYVSQYREFLEDHKDSSELRGLLSGVA